MIDPASLVDKIWRSAIRPSLPMTVSEWADRHRILPVDSAEPGPWRTSRTPYLKAIMDALSEGSGYERVVVMAGSQVGKTEAGLNFLGWMIDHAPGLALMVQPSLEMSHRNVRSRIDPMINTTPRLAELIGPPRSKDSTNSLKMKAYPGGQLVLTGANAGASLRSTPARYIFLDEVDAYDGDVDGDGDPVDLAIRRTTTFRSLRKILMVSTPKLAGLSRIDAAFKESNQQIFQLPCVYCGCFQPITWSQIKWPEGKPLEAYFECSECQGHINHYQKLEMLQKGEWISQAAGDGITAGFHLPGLYSPFETWGEQALEHYKVRNDPSRLQVWVNTVLAETWEDKAGETIKDTGLLARREPSSGRVPAQVVLLTAGVDIQGDRIEAQVLGWAPGEECWVVAYEIFPGDPTGAEVWKQLDLFLARRFEHELAVPAMPISATCVDTGGSATRAAYEYIRTRHGRRIWGIKGASLPNSPAWPKKPSYSNKGSVPLYTIGVDALKDTIAARLPVTSAGAGCIHFPSFLPPHYFAQLTAEVRRTKIVRGRPQRYWEPKIKGSRNEAFDTMVYGLAALTGLITLGTNLEIEKTRLAAQLAGEPIRRPTKVVSKFMQR
jgi:phage terminase large subunit GpA-like protein